MATFSNTKKVAGAALPPCPADLNGNGKYVPGVGWINKANVPTPAALRLQLARPSWEHGP